jgi:predicted dithiol-disulfide oxidoreductase (DUF899 family)
MTEHKTGTREEWLAARMQLREREKELADRNDELTKERRELPWVRLDKEYRFDTDEGPKTLAELFDGRSQLLVYHFMFGPDWTAGCPGCSFTADHIDGVVVHLAQQGATMVCVAHAPLEKLQAYKRRMGWTVPFVSAHGSDFNFDFDVSFTDEQRRGGAEYNFEPVDFDEVLAGFAKSEAIAEIAASCGTDLEGYVTKERPGLSAFALEDGVVYHTYSAYGPDLGGWRFTYNQLLDRAPIGARDDDLSRVRRHDEYGR